MDEDGPELGVGFAIDFHDSFGRLKTLDELIGATQANAVREFQKIEAASKGVVSLSGATAQVTAFGNAATRELATASREMTRVEKSGEAMVRQLERQNAAFGKSREELRMMRAEAAAVSAEQKGLTELAARIRATESALAGQELAAARRARFAAEELAETKAMAEAAAAKQATLDRVLAERALNSQLAERAQLEAAIGRNTGLGRTRATDAGATFSALAAQAAEQEARAATAAATAQRRHADEHQRLATMLRDSQAAMLADAAAAERLRTSTDPLYAATKRLNAEIAESTRLYHIGATAPAEYARQQQVLQARLTDVVATHRSMDQSMKRGSGTLTQLSFQLNDVATMAAMGAPAFQIFASQAGQIFQVAQMAEGGVKGFLAEIGGVASRFAPALAVLAVASGAFALFQRSIVDGTDAKELTRNLGLTKAEIKQLKDVGIGTSDVLKATFQVLAEQAGISFTGMGKAWSNALDWMTDVGRQAMANIYANTVGTFKAVWAATVAIRDGKGLDGAWNAAADAYTGAQGEANKYLKDTGAAIRARALKNEREDLAKQARAIIADRTPKKDKVDHHAQQLARENAAIEAQIKNLYALADAWGVSGAAALIAEARTKAETDAIKKRGDIEVFVNRQVRLAIAERVKDAASATASIREQADAQARANALIASGFSNLEAENYVKDRIADLPLLAALEAAQQRGLTAEADRATRALAEQRGEREKLREIEEQGRFAADMTTGNNRLAELREELRLIGATDEARARSMAELKAAQEASGKYLTPERQDEYVRQQGEIAAQGVRNTQAQDAYNASLTFTAEKWDIIAGKVQAAGQGMADAFGEAGRAIGDMAAIYADYQAGREAAEVEHAAAIRKAAGNEKLLAQEQARFALRSSNAQIGAMGDMTSAAKGFFKERSKGYRAMEAAEKAFRAVEFAMSVRSMIQDASETISSVTNSAARATAAGAEGVATQSKLPFPANIAAMAATAAALVAAGIAVLGGGGGGSSTLPRSNEGMGTVLGDADAKSESVTRAIEDLKNIDTTMLTYSRQMAASLRSIEGQIGGFASLVLRTGDVNANGGVNQGFKANAIGSVLGAVPLVGGLLKGLFGTKTTVVGSGLYGGDQSLGNILSGGYDASYYSDVQKKKKLFGITTSTKYSTQYSDADAGLENQFTLILREFNNAIIAAAGPLGESTDAIQRRLNGFAVGIGKIDLQGLTGEEIEEKLTAVFGAAADNMARAAFPGIERFQKAGEGLFETLVRVSSTVEGVTSSLTLLGSSTSALSTDVKLALAEQFDSVGDFTGATSAYFETFYSQQEQSAARSAQMARAFDTLGMRMPATLAGFRQLVEAQNLTTAAGQSTYATLLQLAPAFSDLQAAMNGAKSAADIMSERQDLERRILELQGNTDALRAMDLVRVDQSNRALQNQIWAIEDAREAAAAADRLREAWTGVGKSIMDEVRRIRGITEASGGGSFAALQGQFNAATSMARGGDKEAADRLVGLSQSVIVAATNAATSRQELERIKAQVAASLEGTYGVISMIASSGVNTPISTLMAAATASQAANAPAPADDDVMSELRAMRHELIQLRSENNAGHAQTAKNTGRTANKLDDVTARSGGNAVSVVAA